MERSSDTQNSVAYLGDKAFLVADQKDSFVMYAVAAHSWVSMGDPVGSESSGRDLVWKFAENAYAAGRFPVFYAVGDRYLTNYLDLGLAILKIGEVARVDLATFTMDGKHASDFRYALKRAGRDGLNFAVLPREDVPAVMAELNEVSDSWLAIKSGHEKSFSLGRFDPAYLREFDCAVLRKGGVIVAFANLWRSGDGSELSIDLMRYRPGVSKVTMDALFAHLLLYGRTQGYIWFNLGAAPLAGLAQHPLASTWNKVGTFVYSRADEFYNFEGLRSFKEKFQPVWTPQFLACPGGLRLPQALLDVTTLISGSAMGALKR
ncbi:bifunctional lysylphosphatidylglycerol flippase/synthetase MprF [Pseudaminobacter arsenicus]|uniref:Bifunctional lysylphosphatidylglycerol flippase/synthetase MprF n=1 Tax=Borborobacter arsenicus TaxID=1851146 RepID=A0A432V3T3_9HYPH|nr:phosphatidylglycerol lysyltransferase domain-containing protein [Pseudaminobacter arsenicus]RUM96778.1 bifunctional lysylphosphatidylglycerol flippase/synthetase MprF [Pseudaminobacter arsenicus]